MQTSLNCVYAPRWPLREAQSGWSAKAWCVKHTRPGVVSELFFFFFFADYKVSSCLSFVKSREFMGGGEGEGSAGRAYWRWTLGSPGHCLFVCSGSEETKGSGGAGFVAKTIGVMVRLAPSHRGAPGSGAKALCKRDFVCCVFFFRPAHTASPAHMQSEKPSSWGVLFNPLYWSWTPEFASDISQKGGGCCVTARLFNFVCVCVCDYFYP